jgi:hypothetical protein
MSRNKQNGLPLIRQDFKRAIDRRNGPRQEQACELYFREVSPNGRIKTWFADKIYDKIDFI